MNWHNLLYKRVYKHQWWPTNDDSHESTLFWWSFLADFGRRPFVSLLGFLLAFFSFSSAFWDIFSALFIFILYVLLPLDEFIIIFFQSLAFNNFVSFLWSQNKQQFFQISSSVSNKTVRSFQGLLLTIESSHKFGEKSACIFGISQTHVDGS